MKNKDEDKSLKTDNILGLMYLLCGTLILSLVLAIVELVVYWQRGILKADVCYEIYFSEFSCFYLKLIRYSNA